VAGDLKAEKKVIMGCPHLTAPQTFAAKNDAHAATPEKHKNLTA
jgi:hypothetical protein